MTKLSFRVHHNPILLIYPLVSPFPGCPLLVGICHSCGWLSNPECPRSLLGDTPYSRMGLIWGSLCRSSPGHGSHRLRRTPIAFLAAHSCRVLRGKNGTRAGLPHVCDVFFWLGSRSVLNLGEPGDPPVAHYPITIPLPPCADGGRYSGRKWAPWN